MHRFLGRVITSASQVIVFPVVCLRLKQKADVTNLLPILVIPGFIVVQSPRLQRARGTKKMGDHFWSDKGLTTT